MRRQREGAIRQVVRSRKVLLRRPFPGQHESSEIAAGAVFSPAAFSSGDHLRFPNDCRLMRTFGQQAAYVMTHPGVFTACVLRAFAIGARYERPPIRTGQGFRAGSGTSTMVSPPVLPFSPLAPSAPIIPVEPVEPVIPVEPVAPVAPVSPFSAGAPGAPCGPAGPGTGTTTAGGGAAGTTTVGRSHALNVSAENAATTAIEYFMSILPKMSNKSWRGIAHSHSKINVSLPPPGAIVRQASVCGAPAKPTRPCDACA